MKNRKKDRRPVLVTLPDDQLAEYRRRRAAFEMAHLQALAAGAYLDQHVAVLRDEHSLPRFWDLDTDTGAVRAADVPEETNVDG